MRGAEHEGLQHECRGDAQPAQAVARADERADRRAGWRGTAHSSMKPACSDVAIGVSAGTADAEDVRIGQRLGGLPPSEIAIGRRSRSAR